MPSRFEIQAFLCMLWLAPVYCCAQELEFAGNLVCDLDYFQMCVHGDHSCSWGQVVDIDGKQTLIIDVGKKWVALYEGDDLVYEGTISTVTIVKNMLYLHGLNPDSKRSKDGTRWLARIEKAQGALSVASLADTKGYLIFGSCRNQ